MPSVLPFNPIGLVCKANFGNNCIAMNKTSMNYHFSYTSFGSHNLIALLEADSEVDSPFTKLLAAPIGTLQA
jgi:hypothetical protein